MADGEKLDEARPDHDAGAHPHEPHLHPRPGDRQGHSPSRLRRPCRDHGSVGGAARASDLGPPPRVPPPSHRPAEALGRRVLIGGGGDERRGRERRSSP